MQNVYAKASDLQPYFPKQSIMEISDDIVDNTIGAPKDLTTMMLVASPHQRALRISKLKSP